MTARPAGRRFGTAARLSAFLALLLAGVLAVTAFETERAFTARSVATTTQTMVAELENFNRAAAGTPAGGLTPFAERYLAGRALPQGETVMVGLPDGGRLGSAGSGPLLGSERVRDLMAEPPARTVTEQVTVGARTVRLMATPVVVGHRRVGALVVAADLHQLQADQRSVLLLVLGEAAVALVAAVAGTYLLLRRLLQNIGEITSAASAIEEGELDQRLGDQGTDDEVGQLAATFDSMLDRISAAMTAQRQLLSDVSHQLRTPLTVARGHLEVLVRHGPRDLRDLEETVSVVIGELDHMRALVEQLLLLGRTLEPDFLEIERLDLRSFLAELFDASCVLADRRWRMTPVPDLVLEVDAAKLRGALFNLVDNAVHATRPGDAIELGVSVLADGSVALTVDDSGPGIPPELREKITDRFARPGAVDAEGSGLGLAIVKAVAEAHGGRFELGTSPFGGCRAAIVLSGGRVRTSDPQVLVEA